MENHYFKILIIFHNITVFLHVDSDLKSIRDFFKKKR